MLSVKLLDQLQRVRLMQDKVGAAKEAASVVAGLTGVPVPVHTDSMS